jgi:hypothetical protein
MLSLDTSGSIFTLLWESVFYLDQSCSTMGKIILLCLQ